MQSKSTRGVQQEEVWAAADALIAAGERPTIERVRLKIGRGSPNTVSPMLESWFATLAPRLGVAASGAQAAEEGAPKELRRALDGVWVTAVAAARDQADRALDPERNRLVQQSQELEAAREELSQRETALAGRGLALEQTLDLARTQLKEQADQLEAAATQLAQARASLAKLVEERDADRRRFDALAEVAAQERERLQAREQTTERRLLEEVDRARQEAKQARGELGEATRRHQSVLEEVQRNLQKIIETEAQARLEVATLRERLAAGDHRVQDLQSQLSAARSVPAAPAGGARKKAGAPRKPVRN